MNMKASTMLMLCLAAALCGTAVSQELTKEAKIERILVLTKSEATIDQMYSQMKSTMASQLPANSTSDQRANAQQMMEKVMDLVKSRLTWEKMRPQYIKIYSDTFSEEEIDGLLAFYQTPTGKAMIEKTPALMSSVMTLTQAQMRDIMPEIQRMVRDGAGNR